jgi:hypothetical protein
MSPWLQFEFSFQCILKKLSILSYEFATRQLVSPAGAAAAMGQ